MCIRDRNYGLGLDHATFKGQPGYGHSGGGIGAGCQLYYFFLLLTSDAADERSCVDLGCGPVLKKKKKHKEAHHATQSTQRRNDYIESSQQYSKRHTR